jgi:hypothetical protein
LVTNVSPPKVVPSFTIVDTPPTDVIGKNLCFTNVNTLRENDIIRLNEDGTLTVPITIPEAIHDLGTGLTKAQLAQIDCYTVEPNVLIKCR